MHERVPVVVGTDCEKSCVVIGSPSFEPRGNGQRRLAEHTHLKQVQHDQEPPDSAVAIVEWMQRFELVVRHCGRDQGVDRL